MLTVSGLERAELCPASTVLPHIDTGDSIASHHGRAVHAYLDAINKGAPPAQALMQVPALHREACAAIDLSLVPHFDANGATGTWSSELAMVLNLEERTSRLLGDGVEHRDYGPVRAGVELAGTADLVGVSDEEVVVIDVKTGRRWLGAPSESLQLLAYALGVAWLTGATRAKVGFLFVRDGEQPRLWMEEVDAMGLEAAAERIRSIVQVDDFTSPEPKPGSHCTYCPAYRGCPAHAVMLQGLLSNHLDHARNKLLGQGEGTVLRVEDLPLLRERVKAAKDLVARLEEEVNEAIRTVGPIPLGDGRVLGDVEVLTETIDAEAARPVLEGMFGTEAVAGAVKIEASITKKALDVLIRARAKAEGQTIKDATDGVYGVLHQVGAVRIGRYFKIDVRKVKP